MKADPILLVEDSEDDLLLMQYAFQEAGVKNRICTVCDGRDAIDYLEGVGPYANRDKYPLPCAIITDLKMPRVDGMTLLKWLQTRRDFFRMPKLVLSTSGLESDRQEAAHLGACGYFVKPADLHELVQVAVNIDQNWLPEHCLLPKTA